MYTDKEIGGKSIIWQPNAVTNSPVFHRLWGSNLNVFKEEYK